MNCPFCKTPMNHSADGEYYKCNTEVLISSQEKIKHLTFYTKVNSYLVQFYNFSYECIKDDDSTITCYSSDSIPTFEFNIPEIDIHNISYEQLEQKILLFL